MTDLCESEINFMTIIIILNKFKQCDRWQFHLICVTFLYCILFDRHCCFERILSKNRENSDAQKKRNEKWIKSKTNPNGNVRSVCKYTGTYVVWVYNIFLTCYLYVYWMTIMVSSLKHKHNITCRFCLFYSSWTIISPKRRINFLNTKVYCNI